MLKKLMFTASIGVALLASACNVQSPASATERERQAVAANQDRLIIDIPPPALTTSLERKNLVERLSRINQQNMSGCIYLISQGTVMAFYPVRGKVTSLNAYLAAESRVWTDRGSTGGGNMLVEQPDFDGAYGKNADGVFFFTADSNAYVEWAGEYLWSDQCLSLNQQPKLIREIKDTPPAK